MRMKAENFQRLCEIGEQPYQSTRAQLLIVRRVVRHICSCREEHDRELARLIRQAKRGLPFTQAALDGLLANKRESQQLDRGAIKAMGAQIVAIDRDIKRIMTFAHVADIFAIGISRRAEAETYYAEHGLLGLLFTAQLEDTASMRDGDWYRYYSDRGPSVIAVHEYMIDWMTKNSDKLPDPFAPGAPFYGMPTYSMKPDGTLQRNAPALTVHSQDGSSRVVKRGPGGRHA